MALPHSKAIDAIDVRPLGAHLKDAMTTSLLKTPELQLMRVVLMAGKSLPEHHVPGAITIHCLEGEVVVTTPERECTLGARQLVMLNGGQPHAVHAKVDASLLVTLVMQSG